MKKIDADTRLGDVIHRVVKQFISLEKEELINNFMMQWDRQRAVDLYYAPGDNWFELQGIGFLLMSRFRQSYEEQNLVPVHMENKLSYIDGRKTILLRPDFIAEKAGRLTIYDFKFGRSWLQHEVNESEQLTKYAMAVEQNFNETPPIQVCIVNFVKSSSTVKWLYGAITAEQIEAYRNKDVAMMPSF